MNAPHLDDERLSAHLDGEDPAAAEHLAECGSCRARLEAFRSVAELVGAPVAPPDGAVDAAVAAALAAHASPGGSPVVPLSTAVRRRRTQVGLAAAAAVVTVVLGVSSLRGGAGDDSQNMATREASGSAAAGPDLGDQSDARALAERVRSAVEGEFAAGAVSPTADSAEAGGPGASGGGSTAQNEAAPPPPPEGEAVVAGKRAAAARSSIRPSGPCTATARSEYGRGLGDLVFEGTLRWEGTPAVVLAYRIEGATGALDHRVLVLAQDDCRLLVAQTI